MAFQWTDALMLNTNIRNSICIIAQKTTIKSCLNQRKSNRNRKKIMQFSHLHLKVESTPQVAFPSVIYRKMQCFMGYLLLLISFWESIAMAAYFYGKNKKNWQKKKYFFPIFSVDKSTLRGVYT